MSFARWIKKRFVRTSYNVQYIDFLARASSDNVFTNETDDARNVAVVKNAFLRAKHELRTTLKNRFASNKNLKNVYYAEGGRTIERVFVQLKIAKTKPVQIATGAQKSTVKTRSFRVYARRRCRKTKLNRHHNGVTHDCGVSNYLLFFPSVKQTRRVSRHDRRTASFGKLS